MSDVIPAVCPHCDQPFSSTLLAVVYTVPVNDPCPNCGEHLHGTLTRTGEYIPEEQP